MVDATLVSQMFINLTYPYCNTIQNSFHWNVFFFFIMLGSCLMKCDMAYFVVLYKMNGNVLLTFYYLHYSAVQELAGRV